jgi:hypothetical protein
MPPPARTEVESGEEEDESSQEDLWEQVGSEVESDEEMVVSEPVYLDTGEAQHDASELGWSGSVHDQPEDDLLAEPEPPPESLPEPPPEPESDADVAAESPPVEDAGLAGPPPQEEYDPVSDFFDDGSGFTYGDEAPPSEDVPSAMMEDVAQMYSTPMGVPEPPPLPGLVDRYTPAPVSRQTPVGAPMDERPLYEPTPIPAVTREEIGPPSTEEPDDEEESDYDITAPPPRFPLQVLIGGVFGAGLMLVFAVVVYAVVGAVRGGPASEPSITSPARPEAPAGLEVRSSLMEEGLGDDTDTDTALELEPKEGASEGSPEAGTPPEKAPAPAARPAPRPRPAPAPARPPPVITRTGTLKVRANRKVLITLNGRPVDYAPLDLPVTPGTYILGAALPGRPDTEQSKTVDISAGAIERVEFTF